MRTLPTLLILTAISLAQTAPPRPQYDVASVKPNTSNSGMIRFTGPPGSATFTFTNATLQILVGVAYNVKPFQIEGGTGWISSDRFDISAKPPEGPVTREQSALMLQSLLEDRF
jgi:uncharacterized protein (TIGR03435 family)